MTTTGGQLRTRAFQLGPFAFVVETTHSDDVATVERLFADLPSSTTSHPATAFTLERTRQRGETMWSIGGPSGSLPPSPALNVSLKSMVASVNLAALDMEPEYLHLHAAAAVRNGSAVVISAERDTGKTTTVAHLVNRGWGFLTDETVRLSTDGRSISGFAKPLSVKPGGEAHLEHLRDALIPELDGSGGFRFVPIGSTGAHLAESGSAHLVVCLRRNRQHHAAQDSEQSAPKVRDLHPVDAVVALMQETIDAARYGEAVQCLASLAAASRCVEIEVGTPEQTAEAIERLFDSGTESSDTEVTVLDPTASVAPGVVTVRIGDRVVVHHTVTGQIFGLDAAATQIWEQAGGYRDAGVNLQGPVETAFVEQLGALGVFPEASEMQP